MAVVTEELSIENTSGNLSVLLSLSAISNLTIME